MSEISGVGCISSTKRLDDLELTEVHSIVWLCHLDRAILLQTPLCPKGLLLDRWIDELEVTSFLRYSCALLLGLEIGNQLGDQVTSLLGV